MRLLPAIALLLCLSVAVACRSTHVPRGSDVTDAAAAVVAPPTSSATLARPLAIAGLSLGDIVAGEPPGPSHPKGTIVAAAYEGAREDHVGLVEIDIATGHEVRRTGLLVTVGVSGVFFHRDGEGIHLVTTNGASIVWLTLTGALAEKRRILTTPSRAGAAEPLLIDATVIDGRAIVFVDSRGVKALVIDDRGATLATHDCHADAPVGPTPGLRRVGDLVVETGLVGDDASKVICGARIDGKGKAIVRKLDGPFGEIFVRDGVAYATGAADVRRLDEALAPTGPTVPDPRRCGERASDCEPSEIAARCEGLSGVGVTRAVPMGGAWVVRTFGCCGSTPGGVFVCEGRPRETRAP